MCEFCHVVWIDKSKPIQDRLAAGFSLEYSISFDLQRILEKSYCYCYGRIVNHLKIVDYDDHVLVYVPDFCFEEL